MIVSSWLQIIQFTPSWAVVASNCRDHKTLATSNKECTLDCCYCCICINAEICNFEKHKQDKIIKILLIMIRIVSNISPTVAWNIQNFSLFYIRISTNSQWSVINLCQCSGVVIIFWISLIVKNVAIVAKSGYVKSSMNDCKLTYLSHPFRFALEKHSKTLSSGKLYVPHAPL